MTKSEQRQTIRERLADFPLEERVVASQAINTQVLALPEFQRAEVIAIYASLASEPDTSLLFRAAPERVVFPKVDTATGHMEFYRIHEESELLRGAFGVREPDPARAALVPTAQIDFILVPGVAFDRRGWRLGRGGGFYDRLLSQLNGTARRIGCFFACQELELITQEAHDERLDMIVTERETIPATDK